MTMRDLSYPALIGLAGTIALLLIYASVVTLVSGVEFALEQFGQFWPYVTALAIGFGIQLGLFMYMMRYVEKNSESAKVVAVTGGTSTVAMITCCTHYLANILPLIATAGIVTFVAQYQIQLFWLGIVFNLMGISYIAYKLNIQLSHSRVQV